MPSPDASSRAQNKTLVKTVLVVVACLSVGAYWVHAGLRRLSADASTVGEGIAPTPATVCCAPAGRPEPSSAEKKPAETRSNGLQRQQPNNETAWPSLRRVPHAVVATVPAEAVERWLTEDSCLIDRTLSTRPLLPDHERYRRRPVPTCATFKFTGEFAEVTSPAPGSLWRTFGIRRGDRLTQLNGHRLFQPEAMLELYASISRSITTASPCLMFTFERRDVTLPPRVLCLVPDAPNASARTRGASSHAEKAPIRRLASPVYAFSGAETRKWLLRQDEDLTPPQPASSTDTGTYEHRLFTLGREGLVVRDASRGTPFHTLDLKVGDRIETLNGEDFSTAAGVLRSYASLREAAFSSKNACFRPSGTRQGRSLTPRILCLIND